MDEGEAHVDVTGKEAEPFRFGTKSTDPVVLPTRLGKAEQISAILRAIINIKSEQRFQPQNKPSGLSYLISLAEFDWKLNSRSTEQSSLEGGAHSGQDTY